MFKININNVNNVNYHDIKKDLNVFENNKCYFR